LHLVKQRDGACGDLRLGFSAERGVFETIGGGAGEDL
jgi:hypothetical protein